MQKGRSPVPPPQKHSVFFLFSHVIKQKAFLSFGRKASFFVNNKNQKFLRKVWKTLFA